MEQGKDSERGIAQRFRNGDREAFGEVFDLYAKRLYAFIYHKVHDRQSAEDILSQVFLKAIQSFGRFDPDRGSLAAWLYRISRNAVIDHYRAQVPKVSVDDAWDLADPSSAEADADLAIRLQSVREGMRALSPLEREVLTMRIWSEMSHAEIAAAIGKSEGHSKVTLSRALKKLRRSVPLAALLALMIGGIRIE